TSLGHTFTLQVTPADGSGGFQPCPSAVFWNRIGPSGSEEKKTKSGLAKRMLVTWVVKFVSPRLYFSSATILTPSLPSTSLAPTSHSLPMSSFWARMPTVFGCLFLMYQSSTTRAWLRPAGPVGKIVGHSNSFSE